MNAPKVSGRVPEGVREYRRLAYRALVLQQTGLPAVWDGIDVDGQDLIAAALACGCAGPGWRRCRHRELCLAAALWLDDTSAWVAGYPAEARWEFWVEVEAFAVTCDPWITRAETAARG